MSGVEEGEEKAYRHGLHPEGLEPFRKGSHLLPGQWSYHLTSGAHPLSEAEGPLRKYRGLGSCNAEVIQPGPVLPPNDQKIPETRGGQEGRHCPLPLQDRVRRQRRTVPYGLQGATTQALQ